MQLDLLSYAQEQEEYQNKDEALKIVNKAKERWPNLNVFAVYMGPYYWNYSGYSLAVIVKNRMKVLEVLSGGRTRLDKWYCGFENGFPGHHWCYVKQIRKL